MRQRRRRREHFSVSRWRNKQTSRFPGTELPKGRISEILGKYTKNHLFLNPHRPGEVHYALGGCPTGKPGAGYISKQSNILFNGRIISIKPALFSFLSFHHLLVYRFIMLLSVFYHIFQGNLKYNIYIFHCRWPSPDTSFYITKMRFGCCPTFCLSPPHKTNSFLLSGHAPRLYLGTFERRNSLI